MTLEKFCACFLLPLCIIVAAGCSGAATGNDAPADPVPEGDYLQARIDGKLSTYTDVSAFRTPMFNAINIVAMHETGTSLESVAFSMKNITTTGTYKINPINCSAQISTGGNTYATGLDTGRDYGSLKITKLGDGRIAGTFSTTVYPDAYVTRTPLTVTNGRFDITLPD